MQLRRVAWDLYVQISTFIAWEMSNDRFTILEHARVTKKKKQTKVLMQAQINKQGCSCEHKRIYIYIYIYLWCPSGALASNFFEWYLSSIFISTYSGEALACMFNYRRICVWTLYDMPACSTLEGYVHKFCVVWDLCLHIQFLEDMCTSSMYFLSDLYEFSCLHVQFLEDMCTNFDLYRICACIFQDMCLNSDLYRICAYIFNS